MREFLLQFEFYRQDHEFFYGLAAAALFLILVRFIGWAFFARKCQGVYIPGENGQLFITTHALEDFVIRTLAEQEEMVIDRVKLKKKSREFSVIINIRVSGDTNVQELRPVIEDRVISQVKCRLGIDNLNTVNIIVKNFSAKDSQINRRHKLAMKEFSPREEKENK